MGDLNLTYHEVVNDFLLLQWMDGLFDMVQQNNPIPVQSNHTRYNDTRHLLFNLVQQKNATVVQLINTRYNDIRQLMFNLA
jgi:hypothetical protein